MTSGRWARPSPPPRGGGWDWATLGPKKGPERRDHEGDAGLRRVRHQRDPVLLPGRHPVRHGVAANGSQPSDGNGTKRIGGGLLQLIATIATVMVIVMAMVVVAVVSFIAMVLPTAMTYTSTITTGNTLTLSTAIFIDTTVTIAIIVTLAICITP